jgi:hypothetical protein
VFIDILDHHDCFSIETSILRKLLWILHKESYSISAVTIEMWGRGGIDWKENGRKQEAALWNCQKMKEGTNNDQDIFY